jgi:hypothetical protein
MPPHDHHYNYYSNIYWNIFSLFINYRIYITLRIVITFSSSRARCMGGKDPMRHVWCLIANRKRRPQSSTASPPLPAEAPMLPVVAYPPPPPPGPPIRPPRLLEPSPGNRVKESVWRSTMKYTLMLHLALFYEQWLMSTSFNANSSTQIASFKSNNLLTPVTYKSNGTSVCTVQKKCIIFSITK